MGTHKIKQVSPCPVVVSASPKLTGSSEPMIKPYFLVFSRWAVSGGERSCDRWNGHQALTVRVLPCVSPSCIPFLCPEDRNLI